MKGLRLDSLPVLAAIVIAATVALLFFLIPNRDRVLERALADKDFSRIEKFLSSESGVENPNLRALLAGWLDLNSSLAAASGGLLDAPSVVRLAGPFLSLLGKKSFSASALDGLSKTLAHSGSPEEIEKLAATLPPGERLLVWRAVETAAKAAGNPVALACAARALSDGSVGTALAVAALWQRAGRPDEAAATARAWFDAHPEPFSGEAVPLAALYLGLLRQENRNGEALDFLLAHRSLLDHGSEMADLLARSALATGRSADALPALDDWLRAHPDNADIWLLFADMAMGAGRQELAARALENYLRLHPDDEARQFTRAKALEWSGHPGEAADAYLPLAEKGSRPALDRLIALAPGLHREADLARVLPRFLPESGTSPELVLLASLLVLEGDYDGARTLYHRHLAASPDDLKSLKNLAEIDMEDQLFGEARELFLRAQSLAPTDAAIAHSLVRLDWLEGRYDGVVGRLRQLAAQTKDPSIIQEFYSAAESLGDIPALVEAMELKITHDPEVPADTYRNLAYFNTLLGRKADAKRALERGRDKFAGSTFFREELAAKLASEGEVAGALRELDGRVGPDSPKDLKSLYAYLLNRANRAVDALEFLKKSLSAQEKSDPEFLELTGNLFEELGRFRDAEATYREAVRVAPARIEFQLSLARSLGAQGRDREMQSVLSRIDLANHPEAARDAAQVYLDIENYREASALLRRYLSSAKGSGDSLAWRMLGDATLSTGDPARAKRAYRKSLELVLKEPSAR